MTLKAAELCAGYGGLAAAIEEVFNARTVWVSEFEEAPSKILAHHWPEAPNHGDMTKINWYGVEPVQVLGGGTPCQDLSHAGKRGGMTEGTRSNLWVNMREAIAAIRPTYVVWENVRGAYSAEASSDVEFCAGCMGSESDCNLRALGRVLGDLSDLGYDTQWRGLRASDVGAPHARFRVFVLARRRDAIPDPRGLGRYQAIQHDGSRKATDDRAGIPNESDRLPHGAGPVRTDVADAYNLGYQRGWEARGRRPGLEGSSKPTADPEGRGWGVRERDNVGQASGEVNSSRNDSPTASREVGTSTNWGEYEPAIRRWEAVMGRRAPSPTEPTGRNGGHRLSPKFTEWMMGLPDGWVTDPAIGISRNDMLKACGNGVVPAQAKAALIDMLMAFEELEVAA